MFVNINFGDIAFILGRSLRWSIEQSGKNESSPCGEICVLRRSQFYWAIPIFHTPILIFLLVMSLYLSFLVPLPWPSMVGSSKWPRISATASPPIHFGLCRPLGSKLG